MYVCMYVCMYVFMYVCTYVCVHHPRPVNSFSVWHSFALSPLSFCPPSPCLPPLPLLFSQLLEAYENRYYFQMVMSKHGDGMDLFSFIDSCQFLTEPLTSYMFRQVVSALDYLHQRSILHRDIKVSSTTWIDIATYCMNGSTLALFRRSFVCGGT